jgi:Rrf2 family nitric oxide-sensitive transcriptional repressor
MKLQKNTLYALYGILDSASRPDEQMSTGEIAKTYGVSPHHLAKVLRALVRAGLVESVRGVGGGYRFTGNARRLTLLDVIELFERVGAGDHGIPARRRGRRAEVERALGTVFAEIDEISRATLRSISIATMLKLIERQRPA